MFLCVFYIRTDICFLQYYTDPISGYVFLSLKDCKRYLKTGILGKSSYKPKDKDHIDVELENENTSVSCSFSLASYLSFSSFVNQVGE